MIALVDIIARPLGWVIGAGIGLGVLLTAVATLAYAVFIRPGTTLQRLLALLWSGPVAAVYVFVVWRILRFAGGYVGSSSYPLEHVVRLVTR